MSRLRLDYQIGEGPMKAAKWDACTNGECIGI